MVYIALDGDDRLFTSDVSFLALVRYLLKRDEAPKNRLHLRRGLLFGIIVATPKTEYIVVPTTRYAL